MKRVLMLLLSALVLSVLVTNNATAALEVRGSGVIAGGDGTPYQLIYDTAQDITWFDYSNALGSWGIQDAWASGLVVQFEGMDLDQWRLPRTFEEFADLDQGFGYEGPVGVDGYYDYAWGYNMVNSELGHLYYETLGNLGYYATDGTWPQDGWENQDLGVFAELQDNWYWHETKYSPDPEFMAWYFDFDEGLHGFQNTGISRLGIAVMDGNISAQSEVPLPAAIWLFAAGLAGLAGFRKRP